MFGSDKYKEKWESDVDQRLEALGERQMAMRGQVGEIHGELREVHKSTSRMTDLLEAVHRRLDKINSDMLPADTAQDVHQNWRDVKSHAMRFGSLTKHWLYESLKIAGLVLVGLVVWAFGHGWVPTI
ncbi:MAG: hypothetical protein R3301_16225 [Saprospiraceae bacterium]|nr:hypothetical protein [Saprospiraceae bacterium]